MTNAEQFERILERQGMYKNNYSALYLTDEQIDILIEYVWELRDQVEELEELKAHYMKQIQELTKFNDKGIKENKRLREALKTVLTPEAYEKFKEVGVEGIKPIEWRLE